MRKFWAAGYDGVTTAELAAALGINPPSMYAAFGDKAALFSEASELYIGDLVRALTRDLSHSTASGAVRALLDTAVVGFTRDDAPHGCLVMREPLLADRRLATRDAVRRRLEAAVEDGELPDASHARALADYVNGVLAGIAARALDGATREELQHVADLAFLAVEAQCAPSAARIGA